MYETISPVGKSITVPERIDEDDRSFSLNDIDGARKHYIEHGFVVMRDVIPAGVCDQLMREFRERIKTYPGMIKRIDGEPEPNAFDAHGFMTNPIMNIHESKEAHFKQYSDQVLRILTHRNLQSFLAAFHGPTRRLLTWNQFEANPETYPHQDCFWGEKAVGDIIGAWVALEDIHAEAGRLYVGPSSHTMDMPRLAEARQIVMNSVYPSDPAYRSLILRLIDEGVVTLKAPYVGKGDVIFWDSRTVHGSLVTTDHQYSRASFTAHFESTRGEPWSFSAMGRRVNGVEIGKPPADRLFVDRALSFVRKRLGPARRTPRG